MEYSEQLAIFSRVRSDLLAGRIDQLSVEAFARNLQREVNRRFDIGFQRGDVEHIAARQIQNLRIEISRLAAGLEPVAFR